MQSVIALAVTFWLISLSGALAPGPLTALAVAQGARADRWNGVRLALGHGLVELALVVAVVYGLGNWLQQPKVSGLIGLVGGLFLLWMGYGLIVGGRRGTMRLASEPEGQPGGVMRLGPLAAGALMSVANPYWSLWWVTIGIGYVANVLNVTGLGLAGILIFYLLAHWTTDLGWLGGLGWAVSSGRGWLSDRLYRSILVVCGLFVSGMGAYFLWSGWRFLSM